MERIEDIDEANKRLEWYNKKYGPYIEKRGLRNWKNLFRKPTGQEWLTLILLILAILMAFAYQRDMSICQSYANNHTTSSIIPSQIPEFNPLSNNSLIKIGDKNAPG